jgi:DNA invertase Pin-like site-specific DNA recombinase
MQNRAIIYCRKSTDRDDKQKNSIEAQINACMRTIESNNLFIVDTLIESASAKKSGTREVFESLLSICKKKKIDYIIVDEASRLSRNNTDSARILWLLEDGYIKWIYTTSQKYYGEQISELFMLLLNFGMAKLDNDTRARHIRSRMITCAEKWRCLWKAPFWFKNITVLKDWQVSRKWVIKDPLYWPIVEHIFRMRGVEKKWLIDISSICRKLYGTNIKHNFTVQWLSKLLQNPFYIGMVRYSWKTYQWEHEWIISTSLFEKVQKLQTWYFNHDKQIPEWDLRTQYLFKGLIKDSNWIVLTGEVKKNKYIYYRSQNLRSNSKINISEKKIESQIIEKLNEIVFPKSLYQKMMKIANKYLESKNQNAIELEIELQKEINLITTRENRLLNGYLEGVIDSTICESSSKALSESKVILEARKKELKNRKIEDSTKKITEMFELLENLSESYKQGNYEKKISILQQVEFELFINNKKELTIEESKPLKALKMLNLCVGSDTENRTPVPGMRIPCPNH